MVGHAGKSALLAVLERQKQEARRAEAQRAAASEKRFEQLGRDLEQRERHVDTADDMHGPDILSFLPFMGNPSYVEDDGPLGEPTGVIPHYMHEDPVQSALRPKGRFMHFQGRATQAQGRTHNGLKRYQADMDPERMSMSMQPAMGDTGWGNHPPHRSFSGSL